MTGPDLPDAVLVDMDGTVVDTQPVWSAVIARLATECGAHWDEREDAPGLLGVLVPDLARDLVERGFPPPADTLVDSLVAQVAQAIGGAPPWRPGAVDLLAALADTGVPAALVTTGYRRHAEAVAAAAPHGALRVVVAAEDVRRHKPDPDAYRLALARLGVAPARAVALEDSPPGVRAALGAGLRTLAVEPTVALPDDIANDLLLERVDGLRAAAAVLGLDLPPG